MKDVIWSNTLSVEVREIDEDHQKLVDLFNILIHSVQEGDDPVYINAVFDELITIFVQDCFSTSSNFFRHTFGRTRLIINSYGKRVRLELESCV